MEKHVLEKIIKEISSGNDAAFSELLNFYLKPIFNFVFRICRNTKDAEDITQEVFIKLWKNIKKYKADKNFKAWLFSIARNTTIDWLRKRKAIVFSDFESDEYENNFLDSVSDSKPLPDEMVINVKDKELVEESLGKIPLIYREVIILKYKNEFSFEEIAEIIKKPVNTVKSQHYRALSMLKKMLDATN